MLWRDPSAPRALSNYLRHATDRLKPRLTGAVGEDRIHNKRLIGFVSRVLPNTAQVMDLTRAGSDDNLRVCDDRNASQYIGNPVNIITGGSRANLTGALYFPNTPLQNSGGTTQTAYTIVMAYQFTITGNAQFNDSYSPLPGGSPIKGAFLAEGVEPVQRKSTQIGGITSSIRPQAL